MGLGAALVLLNKLCSGSSALGILKWGIEPVCLLAAFLSWQRRVVPDWALRPPRSSCEPGLADL